MSDQSMAAADAKKVITPQFSADEELAEVRSELAKNRSASGVGNQDLHELDIAQLLNRAFDAAHQHESLADHGFEFDDVAEQHPTDASADSHDHLEEHEVKIRLGSGEEVDFENDFGPTPEQSTAAPELSASLEQEQQRGSTVKDEAVNAALDAAQAKMAADTLDAVATSQAAAGPNMNSPEHQIRVGLIQGLGMLGGAGLAGLAHMLRSGGASVNNKIRTRQYGKLSTEIDAIAENMDALMTKMGDNGLSTGVAGLTGANRAEFVKEFLEQPENKGLYNDLLRSIGNLATKGAQAAVIGAGAGLSSDQLDVEITKRISDVQEKHKQILDSLTDHNGVSLSDRLNNVVNAIADAIAKLFQRASQAMGFGPRQGM